MGQVTQASCLFHLFLTDCLSDAHRFAMLHVHFNQCYPFCTCCEFLCLSHLPFVTGSMTLESFGFDVSAFHIREVRNLFYWLWNVVVACSVPSEKKHTFVTRCNMVRFDCTEPSAVHVRRIQVCIIIANVQSLCVHLCAFTVPFV